MVEESLHITIGSCPPPSTTGISEDLHHDIELVKSAILYADEVLLCSPTSNLLGSVYSTSRTMSNGSFNERVHVLSGLSKTVQMPTSASTLLQACLEIASKKHLSSKELIFKQRITKELDKFWEQFESSSYGLVEGDVIKQFFGAADAGYLKFQNFDFPSPLSPPVDVFFRFTELIRAALSDLSTYPLLDAMTRSMVSLGIIKGTFLQSDSAVDRAKQIGLAANLFERLPHFELASLDEIIDIRSELQTYLARFRSATIKYSASIASTQWDSKFPYDVEQVFLGDVTPALKDIEEQIRSNNYLAKLTSRYAQKPSSFTVPALSLALTQFAQWLDILSAVFGISSIAANMIDILNAWRQTKREISQNQLFFYYEASRRLSE
jgi:hypothetical protein